MHLLELMKVKGEKALLIMEQIEDHNQVVIENTALQKRVLDLEDEKKEMLKVNSKLHADAKGLKEKVKDQKSKCKIEIDQSKEFRVKLKRSEQFF